MQTVCLRLWRADDPDAMLAARACRECLRTISARRSTRFRPTSRGAAIALLSQMVTSAGDAQRHVGRGPDAARARGGRRHPRPLLEMPSSGSRASRGWSAASGAATSSSTRSRASSCCPGSAAAVREFQRMLERHRERRRMRRRRGDRRGHVPVRRDRGVLAGGRLNRGAHAERRPRRPARSPWPRRRRRCHRRPDVSLELALAAYRVRSERPEGRNSMLGALARPRRSGRWGSCMATRRGGRAWCSARDGATVASSATTGPSACGTRRPTGRSGTPLTTRPGHGLTTTISPDGRALPPPPDDTRIRLWNVRSERQRVPDRSAATRTPTTPSPSAPTAARSRLGRLRAGALTDPALGRAARTGIGQRSRQSSVNPRVQPGRARLAAAGDDGPPALGRDPPEARSARSKDGRAG